MTTLRHLKTNDKVQFEMLVSMLMSNCKVKPKYEQNIISRLAKQIRNRYYNSRKVKQIGYKKKIYNDTNQLKLSIGILNTNNQNYVLKNKTK